MIMFMISFETLKCAPRRARPAAGLDSLLRAGAQLPKGVMAQLQVRRPLQAPPGGIGGHRGIIQRHASWGSLLPVTVELSLTHCSGPLGCHQ